MDPAPGAQNPGARENAGRVQVSLDTMREFTDKRFERRVAALVNSGQRGVLCGGRKGVEKEALRVTPHGQIAQTAHPPALGAALTNPRITTDFSEALIELVTPPFGQSWELLQYLCDLHQFVYRHLGDEMLWATSMPCAVRSDEEIPIARYGPSNVGRLKTIYRNGLSLRYGRMMQAIAGVHFNYSFPASLWEALAPLEGAGAVDTAFVSDAYFAALRNYRRFGWLILYLFGTSPAVSRAFLAGRDHDLPALDADTLYEPYATSLRMSDIGYRNKNQATVSVSVNSLQAYVRDLNHAIRTPFPGYEKLGVKVGGEYRQLSANVLQVGNEYYSFIRPKRVVRSGERPTRALERGGVEYLEMRALDVSVFDPVGVNQETLRFAEAFLALCLLRDSPPIDRDEQQALDRNHVTVARRGREPGLCLSHGGRDRPMRDWARELLDDMEAVCELLDQDDPGAPYRGSLVRQREKVEDPAATPSARLLAEMRDAGETFFQFALRMSRVHKDYFLGLYPPNESRLAEFAIAAEESHAQQRRIEAGDREDLDAYLARYLAG